jgi:hypothetical protein
MLTELLRQASTSVFLTSVKYWRGATCWYRVSRMMQFVQRLWGWYKQTDKTEKLITWTSLRLWRTKSKVITTGNLPPWVIPLRSNPSALCHSVFRQRHYPSHLSSVSYHSSLLVLSHTDKEVCAISRNWFLFYYSVVNLFFLSLSHTLTSTNICLHHFPLLICWWLHNFLSPSSFHQRAFLWSLHSFTPTSIHLPYSCF